MLTPTAEIEVIGTRRRRRVTALIDTGFSGYLCIPTTIARDLGLELCGSQEVELADGRWIKQLEFHGKVRFLDHEHHVIIALTDSETALIGTSLLGDCRLTIDFPAKKIQLKRKNPT